MKTTDLIHKLQVLLEKHGDKELEFRVKDHYSRYGAEMDFNLQVGDTTGIPSHWFGSFTTDNWLRLDFSLKSVDGKNPKITFRK